MGILEYGSFWQKGTGIKMNCQKIDKQREIDSIIYICAPLNFLYLSMSSVMLGASVRHSTHGKGHEEGGSTYTKAGLSLRSPPGNPRASTPITRACLLYYFVLSPTPLTLRGAVPHHLFRRSS